MSVVDRLYVSDLDGTLLNREGRISKSARESLVNMLEEGLLFTVASARSLISMRERLGELPFRLPIIECNGAFISDYHSGAKRVIHALEPNTLRWLHQQCIERDCIHFISTYDGERDRVLYDHRRNGGMDLYLSERYEAGDLRPTVTQDWSELEAQAAVGVTLVGRQHELIQFQRECCHCPDRPLSHHLWEDSYAAGWFWLMIHAPEACKGRAALRVREDFIEGQPPLTVFGDQVNDLGLMRLADRRVAVANACPEIITLADVVLGHHDQDVVAHFLLKEWQERRTRPSSPG
ncbi:MAG: HAD hydrolase family protein [Candidatus Methylacidiphilales bacterium]